MFFYCISSALKQMCQRGGKLLDGNCRGVDTHIVIGVLAPDLTAVIVIIPCAVLIDAVDQSAQLFIAQMLMLVSLFTATAHLGIHIRVDEDAEGV